MDTPDTYTHLFWGYGAIWFCISAFVLLLNSFQRRQLRRLEELERELKNVGPSSRTSFDELTVNNVRN